MGSSTRQSINQSQFFTFSLRRGAKWLNPKNKQSINHNLNIIFEKRSSITKPSEQLKGSSTRQSINQPINQSQFIIIYEKRSNITEPSEQLMGSSTRQAINQSIKSINQSIKSITQLTNQPTNQLISQSIYPPLFKDGNVRLTMIISFIWSSMFYNFLFILWFLCKSVIRISCL